MTRKRWKDPDKRMRRAVDMRRQGWSLRRIGAELAVSEGTIRNDLARWVHQQENQGPARPSLSLVRSAQSLRNGGAQSTADYAGEIRTDYATGEGA